MVLDLYYTCVYCHLLCSHSCKFVTSLLSQPLYCDLSPQSSSIFFSISVGLSVIEKIES